MTDLHAMQALADLHMTRTHRDLKPDNIMISDWDSSDGPNVALIDWGTSSSHQGMYSPKHLHWHALQTSYLVAFT